jgi:O-succinylbenzoate synthase
VIRPTDIEVWDVELPLRRDMTTAIETTASRRSILVKVATAEAEGWGEAAPQVGHTRDSVDEAWALLLTEATRILGAGEPVLIEGSAATSALDQALTALQAAGAGRALPEYVDGAIEPVPASAAIGMTDSPTDLASAVDAIVSAGYEHIKIKIAPGRTQDLAMVRRRFPDLGIAVDANGSFGRAHWDDLLALDDLGLDYVEQPLSVANLTGHAELSRRMEAPVCLDESVRRLGDIVTIATAGAADAVVLKPGRLGPTLTAHGLTLAHRHGLGVKIGGLIESGVGKHHLVSLATHPAVTLPSDLAGSDHYFDRDLVDPPWVVENGALMARPAIAIDEAALAGVTVRQHRFRR